MQPSELIAIYEPNDPVVLSGTHNVFGFTPNEWKAYEKKLGYSLNANEVLTTRKRSLAPA